MPLDVNVTVQPAPDVAARLDEILNVVNAIALQGVRLMAQIDDQHAELLRDLDEIRTAVGAVAGEVAALIERLKTLPSSPDLSDAIASAEAIKAALTAIPPAPES